MMIGVVLLLLAAIVVANQGPVRGLLQARAELAVKEKQVAEIEKGNAAYRAEIARLEKTGYLEALARKQLAYAKPGEDVFIIQGLPASASLPGSDVTPSEQAAQSADDAVVEPAAAEAASPGTSSAAASHSGWFGRLLSALRGLR
jgi:cell division protein FtsB